MKFLNYFCFWITRYECVHHGKREYLHDDHKVRQELHEKDSKSRLNYYCEDCREFCCEYCIALGPHNNELHRLSRLDDFAERSSDYIAAFLRESAKDKSRALFNKIK